MNHSYIFSSSPTSNSFIRIIVSDGVGIFREEISECREKGESFDSVLLSHRNPVSPSRCSHTSPNIHHHESLWNLAPCPAIASYVPSNEQILIWGDELFNAYNFTFVKFNSCAHQDGVMNIAANRWVNSFRIQTTTESSSRMYMGKFATNYNPICFERKLAELS